LHEAIRQQATGAEFSRDEFVVKSLEIYKTKSPADFAAKSIVKTKGGE